MICQKCGYENTPGDRLCAKCQNDLDFRALDSQMININDLELVEEDQAQAPEKTATKKSSHKTLWVLLVLLAVIALVVMLVVKPLYERHLKAGLISEAVAATRIKVERYARENRSWPMSVRDIKGAVSKYSMAELGITINNGVIELAISEEPGKKAKFSPSINDRGYVVWECDHGGISQDYLPEICLAGR